MSVARALLIVIQISFLFFIVGVLYTCKFKNILKNNLIIKLIVNHITKDDVSAHL